MIFFVVVEEREKKATHCGRCRQQAMIAISNESTTTERERAHNGGNNSVRTTYMCVNRVKGKRLRDVFSAVVILAHRS